MNLRLKPSLSIDARGYMCPYPIMMLSFNIKNINIGDIIEVKATDPAFERDILSWAEETGNEVVGLHKTKEEIVAYVRRVK